ncbi:MAG TPA: ABC transporter substrate-binding protein [Acidimicrobiales bacterium]|nr:ABC transporter substrate-binding protein [Acidimicrobiales bacterium]
MARPLRVGILNDMSDEPVPGNAERWLRLAVDDLRSSGRLDRDVELVQAWGLGLPSGSAAAVERAYAELVDQDVLLIVGPAIGDDALVATPLADRFRVPTINWAGSERARSEYMFHLQVGSHEDESIILARHLAALGARRIGVVFDRSPIGRRHLLFLHSEAEALGMQLAGSASVAPLAEDADTEVRGVLGSAVDAVVYLGLGLSAPAVAGALAAQGWNGPRAMNTCGLRGYDPEFGVRIDGWVYVDMVSDDNATFAELRRRLELPANTGPGPAYGFDLGRLVAEGLARAPERTRDGVKEGLEQVKWLPAAEGHDGTLLGFGHHDRGALHGRYLVLRQWASGQSVEIGSATSELAD